MNDDEFYVGYLDRPPPRLARWLRGIVAALIIGGAFVAGLWISAQLPFGPGVFEFGHSRHFEGVLSLQPYPSLLVERPGRISPDWSGGAAAAGPEFSRYWLSGPGKEGADRLVAGLDGQAVALSGTLIYRDQQTFIKLDGAAVTALPPDGRDHFSVRSLALTPRALGTVDVSGEIIDPQCYLGIMKPGFGIPHRACAIRCLAGGVPPLLRSTDGGGITRYYLLLGPGGERINRQLLPWAAETLHLHGQAFAYGDQLALRIDVASLDGSAAGLSSAGGTGSR